jgi:hypothetical protein
MYLGLGPLRTQRLGHGQGEYDVADEGRLDDEDAHGYR